MNQPAIWLSNTAGEYPEKNGHFDAENDHGNHDDQRNTPMYTYMILYAWWLWYIIWLVVWNMFYFSKYWECHHPNWLIFFREVETTNQYMNVFVVIAHIN